MLVNEKKLAFYVERNLNVLFEGERGVGKTSIIYKTFNEANLRVKYFSAPTMDPWTDLVGVPSTVIRNDGKEVLRMIPPEDFADDKYDAIFIDELNRAPPKVLDALMELIQFKTINGKPYNIKMIWAAINPYDENNNDYNVEPLDKALKDRFQIHYKFPYNVDEAFFKKNHGETGIVFCDWWKNQPKEIQKEISPRRLFETTTFYLAGGDIEDMINVGNISLLKQNLKTVTHIQILQKDFAEQKISQSTHILKNEYSNIIKTYLTSNKEVFDFFFKDMNEEFLAREFINKKTVYKYMLENANSNDVEIKNKTKDIVGSIIEGSKNSFLKNNLEDLKDFISEDKKEKLLQTPNLPLLAATSKEESQFLNFFKPFSLGHNAIPATTIMKHITKSILSVTFLGLAKKSVIKGITETRIEEQTVNRIGLFLAMHCVTSNTTTQSSKSIISKITNPKDPSYFWPHEYKHFGERIKAVMEEYRSLTKEELLENYLTMTSKNKIKKMKP